MRLDLTNRTVFRKRSACLRAPVSQTGASAQFVFGVPSAYVAISLGCRLKDQNKPLLLEVYLKEMAVIISPELKEPFK